MTGGKRKRVDTSYIDSINVLNNMSNRITKQKLSQIIGTATLEDISNLESVNYHRYFNQPTMRVISSLAIMNLLNNGKLSNHKNRVSHISKLMKTNSNNILQLGGNSQIELTSLNHLLNKLHSTKQTGGGARLNKVLEQIKKFVAPLNEIFDDL